MKRHEYIEVKLSKDPITGKQELTLAAPYFISPATARKLSRELIKVAAKAEALNKKKKVKK